MASSHLRCLSRQVRQPVRTLFGLLAPSPSCSPLAVPLLSAFAFFTGFRPVGRGGSLRFRDCGVARSPLADGPEDSGVRALEGYGAYCESRAGCRYADCSISVASASGGLARESQLARVVGCMEIGYRGTCMLRRVVAVDDIGWRSRQVLMLLPCGPLRMVGEWPGSWIQDGLVVTGDAVESVSLLHAQSGDSVVGLRRYRGRLR